MIRFLSGIGLTVLLCAPIASAQRPAECVDPFIGTVGGGNTFPGAVRAWGLVSVSPHNAPGSPSGYIRGEKRCTGFGHIHLSGTGCGDFGSVILSFSRRTDVFAAPSQSCLLDSEAAHPGFYSAVLSDLGLTYQASVTRRCGISRIITRRPGPLRVYLDAGTSLAITGGGACRVENAREARGIDIAGGFCGESNREAIAFVCRFNRRSLRSGTWIGGRASGASSVAAADTELGAWFDFDMGGNDTLLVKVGLSLADHPDTNLDAEMPGWDFDSVANDASREWNRLLSRISVSGGTREDSVKFYTAFYHALIHPSIVSDVDGDYPGMNGAGVLHHDYDRYSVFSLWDTYRTLHPFLTLVFPERQSAMIRTMLDMYKESGWLPKWELAGNETHMMVGDGAVCVIADSYVRGIRDFNVAVAVDAIRKHTEFPRNDSARAARPGYDEYLKLGYIPFDQDTTQAWWVWGPVSTTLEYCVADFAASQMMRQCGSASFADQLLKRSGFYANVFDAASLFMRPRLRNGNWLTPFDPLATEGSGNWSGSGGPGFVEGNAWQYTWFVPHAMAGLISRFGSSSVFAAKLDSCFRLNYFTINNEPDMAYPYLFDYVPGAESRTRELVAEICRDRFTTGPGGLPGNDDAGTTSSWYLFSAMGVYPDSPGSLDYQLGWPAFDSVVITLDPAYWPGRRIVIAKEGGIRPEAKDLQWICNGKVLDRPTISHAWLVQGGTLTLSRMKR